MQQIIDTAEAEPSLELAIDAFVEMARDALADLETPAPCGHEECGQRDRELLQDARGLAELRLADVEKLGVNPADAAKILAMVDDRFIVPGLDLMFIPAIDIHAAFLACVVAFWDAAQVQATPTAEEATT